MVAKDSTPRVLIIGLDLGVGELVQEWCKQGFLPVFRSLTDHGTWGFLNTTAEVLHASAWPSLYTGTMPGKHGVYYTFQPAPGIQGYQRFGPTQYGQPSFWQILSTAGKKCIIFDAPYTHPVKDFTGIQVFEWGTWAHYWKPMSTPPEIMGQLKKYFGDYPLGLEANKVGMGSLDPIDIHKLLIKAVVAKVEAGLWLMCNQPWDLFLMVFGETHPAAHYCWSPDQNSVVTNSKSIHSILREIYEAIDRGIGEIIECIGEDVTLFIISADSVGPNYSGWHLLPKVLQRLGFIVGPETQNSLSASKSLNYDSKGALLHSIKNLIPPILRKSIARKLPNSVRDFINLRVETAGIDWSKSRAYCLPTDLEGYIRINLKGREPEGIVDQGLEYKKVCEELAASLSRLINPVTGRPAVRQIIRTEETLSGNRRHYLPDLIVLWSPEAEITELNSPEFGTLRVPSPDARTGTHYPPGFIIASGASIPQGHIIEGRHIIDFAPTILSLFNRHIPDQMDGNVWNDLQI